MLQWWRTLLRAQNSITNIDGEAAALCAAVGVAGTAFFGVAIKTRGSQSDSAQD